MHRRSQECGYSGRPKSESRAWQAVGMLEFDSRKRHFWLQYPKGIVTESAFRVPVGLVRTEYSDSLARERMLRYRGLHRNPQVLGWRRAGIRAWSSRGDRGGCVSTRLVLCRAVLNTQGELGSCRAVVPRRQRTSHSVSPRGTVLRARTTPPPGSQVRYKAPSGISARTAVGRSTSIRCDEPGPVTATVG